MAKEMFMAWMKTVGVQHEQEGKGRENGVQRRERQLCVRWKHVILCRACGFNDYKPLVFVIHMQKRGRQTCGRKAAK